MPTSSASGAHFPIGGTGARRARPVVRLIEGRGACAAERRSSASSWSVAARPACVWRAVRRSARRRRPERGLGVDVPSSRRPSTGRSGPTAASSRGAYSMGLFVWYFGTKRRYPPTSSRTTPSRSGPGTGGPPHRAFDRHRPRRTSAPPPSPDGPRIPEWRRRPDAFYVLEPGPHPPESGNGLEGAGGAIPREDRGEPPRSGTIRLSCPRRSPSPEPSRRKDSTDDLASFRGAAFGMEPVPQSAYFRPHNQSEDVEGLYPVGAAPILARGRVGVPPRASDDHRA